MPVLHRALIIHQVIFTGTNRHTVLSKPPSFYTYKRPSFEFEIGKNYLPDDVQLTGVTSEDIRSMLEWYFMHAGLKSATNTSRSILELRAATFLPLICRKTATQTLILLENVNLNIA